MFAFSAFLVLKELFEINNESFFEKKNFRWTGVTFSLIVLLSSIGILISENTIDKIEPYYEPLVSATATIIADINFDSKKVEVIHDLSGLSSIDFINENDTLLTLIGEHSYIYPKIKGGYEFRTELHMSMDDSAFGRPVRKLKETNKLNFYSHLIKDELKLENSKIIFIFNNRIKLKFESNDIFSTHQKLENKWDFYEFNEIDKLFRDFK
jgi:hypothetical protein